MYQRGIGTPYRASLLLQLLHNWQFHNAEGYKNVRTRTAGIGSLMLKTHMNATSQLIALCHGQL